MKKYRKLVLILAIFLFFSKFNFAQAEIVINEVELSPTGERFLELYNTGNEVVDLTDWYMQRKTANGSSFGSLVSSPNFEGKIINANGYFVISKNILNNSDIILDSLTLTESNTIQIKNSSGEVVNKVGWGDSNDCDSSCPSNPVEGKSIQKTETGSWIVSTPTPGVVNVNSATSFNNNNLTNTSSSTSTTTEIKEKTTEEVKMKVQIIGKSFAMTGLPFTLEGIAYGTNGEKLNYGKYFWNFGDGDSKEIRISNVNSLQKFTHTYFYPGEYDVSLEYYLNYYGNIPDASSKITIKVAGADISISAVGDERDFFVELTNNTNYDADISNWILSSNERSFIFPQNTILKTKKKIIVSPKITNLLISDKNTLKLLTPQRETVFDYGASVAVLASVSISSKNIKSKVATSIPDDSFVIDEQIPEENLPASAISSDVVENNGVRAYFLALVLTVFIGTSAVAVYFIRQKRTVLNEGDDFEILEG